MNTYHINPSTEMTLRIAMLTLAGLLALQLMSCSAKPGSTSPSPVDNNPKAVVDSSLLSSQKIAVADEPNIASSTIESLWQNAPVLSALAYPTGSSANQSKMPIGVTIKSVYSQNNIFFLVQYDDATMSMLEQPLRFKGGSYLEHTNWTIDSNTHDDGFSFMFEIAPGASKGMTFQSNGCAMACHATATDQWAPGMFPENDGRYDIWYWRSSESNGTGLASDNISLGAPVYETALDDVNSQVIDNNVDDSPPFLPFYICGGNNAGLDKRFFISKATMDMFGNLNNPVTSMPWAPNDVIPSHIIAKIDPQGNSDLWDVKAHGYWSNGKWTVKFKRALMTASSVDANGNDVGFAAGGEYPFSFAIHNDNAPGDHFGVATKAFKLKLVN